MLLCSVYNLVPIFAGKSEPLEKACGGYYGLQPADAPREPTAGRLMSSCSRAPSAWAPCTSHNTPFDFMKIPDIGDVMNKFEVLGIVGEGESFHLITMWNIKAYFVYLQSATVTTDPVFSHSFSIEVEHSQICCLSEQSFNCFYSICLRYKAVKSCCSWLCNTIRSRTVFKIWKNFEARYSDLNLLLCCCCWNEEVDCGTLFVVNINGTVWFDSSISPKCFSFLFLGATRLI